MTLAGKVLNKVKEANLIEEELIDTKILKKELWKAGGWNDYWSTRDVLNKKLDKYRSTSQLPSSVTQSDLKSLNKELLALSNIINKVTKKIK